MIVVSGIAAALVLMIAGLAYVAHRWDHDRLLQDTAPEDWEYLEQPLTGPWWHRTHPEPPAGSCIPGARR